MILLILGWIGTLMVIGAYALVATNHLDGDSWAARVLNLLGPVCIAIPAAIAGLRNVIVLQVVLVCHHSFCCSETTSKTFPLICSGARTTWDISYERNNDEKLAYDPV
jgi:hypothetical protein